MANFSNDVAEIAYILKRERYSRDTARWDLCRAAFHPDTSRTYVNVAWYVFPRECIPVSKLTASAHVHRYEGKVDDFLHRSARIHQGKVNIIHSSFDPVKIDVHNNRATSEAFCLVSSSITIGNIDYELASHMRLATRLEKSSDTGQWHMLSLEAIYVRDRLVATFPGPHLSSPLIMPEKIWDYPKSYRCLAFVMLNRGLEPRRDLPHEDDEKAVHRIIDRNRAFLKCVEDMVTDG